MLQTMKSRKKGLHYGIIFCVLINIICLSGYVHAAPPNDESTGDAETAKEKAEWESLTDDTDGDTEFTTLLKGADLSDLDGLASSLCMVKWRNTDNKMNRKQEATGWYDTIGTLVSDVAVLAVPSNNLRATTNTTTADWYVRTLTCGLHNKAVRKVIPKSELTTYYHTNFGMSRDSSHRIAIIILKTPIDASMGMKIAELVGNPLVPRTDDPNKPQYDDYAVTACTMVVMDLDITTRKMDLKGLHVVATRCVWNEDQLSNPAYQDRICVHVKIPFKATELISDRMFFPHDQGAPLFCNGLLSGVYAGVQNLDGNLHGDIHTKPEIGPELIYKGRPTTPEEQYVFEVPGSTSNWKFVSGITSKAEHLTWVDTMKVLEDDDCPAAPYPPKLVLEPEDDMELEENTEEVMDDDSESDDGPTETPKAPVKSGRRSSEKESGAAKLNHVVPALAAAVLGVLVVVV